MKCPIFLALLSTADPGDRRYGILYIVDWPRFLYGALIIGGVAGKMPRPNAGEGGVGGNSCLQAGCWSSHPFFPGAD